MKAEILVCTLAVLFLQTFSEARAQSAAPKQDVTSTHPNGVKYERQPWPDSTLNGGKPHNLPGDNLISLPGPCDFDPKRCEPPKDGGGGVSVPPTPFAVISQMVCMGNRTTNCHANTNTWFEASYGNAVSMPCWGVFEVSQNGDTQTVEIYQGSQYGYGTWAGSKTVAVGGVEHTMTLSQTNQAFQPGMFRTSCTVSVK